MNRLANAVLAQAQVGREGTYTRAGLIAGYDPDTYSVKVTIQPEGATTGWLPLGAAWIGNGWGMFAPPSLGDQVEICFLDGEFECGYVSQRFFSDVDRPLPVPAGEFWLVHKSGQSVKLLNTGAVVIDDGHGASASFNGDGTVTSQANLWTHTGDMRLVGSLQHEGNNTTSGDITATGTIQGANVVGTTNVTFGGKSGIGHTHSGVASGSDNSGPPS